MIFKSGYSASLLRQEQTYIRTIRTLLIQKSRKYIHLGEQFCLIYLFSSLLYMFQVSMCPSSGGNHCMVFVILNGWRPDC